MEDKDKLIAELKAYKDVNEDFKTAWEELKAENVNLREKMANIERITREGFKDYYYTYAKNNPFFLNIIKEIEK